MQKFRLTLATLLALSVMPLLSACSSEEPQSEATQETSTQQSSASSTSSDSANKTQNTDPVIVSSKIDTEGTLLGNMILQLLEANDVPTQDKLSLGGLPIVRQAIIGGEVDIVPEYTGNGAFLFKEAEGDPAWKDLQQGWELVKQLDYDANQLVWLPPAQANNTYALGVRADVAEPNDLQTMSDFGQWINNGGEVKVIASQEFVNFAGGLPAFQQAYGFDLQPEQMVIVSGGDTANTIKAAAQQTNGVNTAMVYGTDGAIEPAGLVVMDDDKATQMVYAPAPVIREETLEAYPQIEAILEPVFTSLDAKILRGLNARVQVNGETSSAVAESYLQDHGFLD